MEEKNPQEVGLRKDSCGGTSAAEGTYFRGQKMVPPLTHLSAYSFESPAVLVRRTVQ